MTTLWQYRELFVYLVRRDLTLRYRRSVLGLLWTVLHPLAHMGVIFVVFSGVLSLRTESYAVYVLSGLLFWNFFTQSVTTSMTSLAANRALLLKVPVPKTIFPLSACLSGLANWVISIGPLLLILVVSGHPMGTSLLFLPIAIVVGFLFTAGVGLALAPLAVFFRDVVEMVTVVLRLLYYLTPIMYPITMVPERFTWIIRLNPVGPVLEIFRGPIYLGLIPSVQSMAAALLVALVALAVGATVYRLTGDRVAYHI